MTTSLGRARPAREDVEPPDWSAVPERDADPRRPLIAAVWRAAVGVAVAGGLWLLGHRIPALVLLGVLGLATALSLARPGVARALDRATRTIQRVAGRVLAFVLLGAVHLLVFVPLSLLLRLARRDPLALGVARDAPSLWRPAAGARPLYRRPFADERPASASGARPARGRRLRAALGVVALVVLLDLGLGALLHALTDDDPASAPRASLLFDPGIAAARDEPWVPRLADGIDRVWYAKRHDPFLGWSFPDHDGPHLRVRDGVRRSYAPTRPLPGPPLDVAFLGGSTTFGLFQRDEHTIPSEVARLAERDGIPLRVANHGRMAYNNWQETLLLTQLTSAGLRPDLAVFYDGSNELLGQFRLGPHTEPGHQDAREYAERIGLGRPPAGAPDGSNPAGDLWDAYRDTSGARWLWRRVRGKPTQPVAAAQPLVSPWAVDQAETADDAGRGAAALYRRGVETARRLGAGYGFETAFFWQPSAYSKPPRTGEEGAYGSLATDPEAWTRAYATARRALRPPVVDVADSLDGARAPIMYDFVHTNERGAALVARAIYAELEPTLRRLQRERRR